jgi:hypothetical protein
MGIGRRAKKAASGAGVALATSGLSTCNHGGAVDPPPPPFQCTADVRDGTVLTVSGTLRQVELHVLVRNFSTSTWTAAQVTDVVGGTARPVALAEPLEVVIDLTDGTVRDGSFRLSGTLAGLGSSATCAVARTFLFRVEPDTGRVVVAEADPLPLPERQPARIALLSHEGRDVELEATTAFAGPATLVWTVTGGQIVSRDGPRLRWRLPSEAGLYQAELVADYGPLGFAHDAIVLEVV